MTCPPLGVSCRLRALIAALLALAASGCGAPESPEPEAWQLAAHEAEEAFRAQQVTAAETAFEQALELAVAAGSETGRIAALEGLAACRAVQGDMAAADSLYDIVLARQTRRFAADSLGGEVMVRTLGTLGEINLRLNRPADAGPFFRRILVLADSGAVDLSPREPRLAYVLHGLAQVADAGGDSVAADTLRARAVGLQLFAEGFAAWIGQDLTRAEQDLRRALEHQRRALGATHPDLALSAHCLGRVLEASGRADEAGDLYRQAAQVHAATGGDPIEHATVLDDLAQLLADAEPGRADSLRTRAEQLRRQLR